MPMETMVETMPSMESVVLVESMSSAVSMVLWNGGVHDAHESHGLRGIHALRHDLLVSTSGPGIIDNTRPAQ